MAEEILGKEGWRAICMISGGVTRQFGVLATDSAMYDTELGKTTFESPKLFITAKSGCVISFIGTAAYFQGFPVEQYTQPFDALVVTLKDWFLGKRAEVAKLLEDNVADPDENKPNLCVLVLGMHKGFPTVAQLNSFLDFQPKYLWTKEGPKFSTLIYGDDSDKNEMFKEASEYMELKAKQHEEGLTPGIMGEILTRGIYKKADDEKRKFGKKYAGGVVNVAVATSKGSYSLSNFLVIGG